MESKKTYTNKDCKDLDELNWFHFQNSKITIWHRPKTSHIQLLKSLFKLTHLITVQSDRENLSDIQKTCLANEIAWIHIPLEGANMPLLKRKESKQKIFEGLNIVAEVLKSKESANILIHCAAGIHRTGVITYSLLRILGYVSFFIYISIFVILDSLVKNQ